MRAGSDLEKRWMDLAAARERILGQAHLNAFISLTDESGEGPVVAVKDLIYVRGTWTTAGSMMLPFVPDREDAEVVQHIRRHGCVVVGKTNLHEWAFGVTSTNLHFGPVRNPHDPTRVAGGSSGGSAAAVAAGMCDWAIGTDTGGSIRIPAALCGVVGVKPTLGAISTQGVIPLGRSFDTVGPLASDVYTASLALEMMTGRTDFVPRRQPDPAAIRLAVPAGWDEDLDNEVRLAWTPIAAGLPRIQLPDLREMLRVGLDVLNWEAADLHRSRIESNPDAYGEDVLRRLRDASEVSRETYEIGLAEVPRLRAAVEEAMAGVDAILTPATAIVAPRIGEIGVGEQLTRFTRPFNVTGQPVVTLPLKSSGLPVGVQLIGHYGQDAQLLEIASSLETRWHENPTGHG
jgi:aspartyl-tRNA(Asn)/glutamyl-tRNA(Gln) amidotransferase subunit A